MTLQGSWYGNMLPHTKFTAPSGSGSTAYHNTVHFIWGTLVGQGMAHLPVVHITLWCLRLSEQGTLNYSAHHSLVRIWCTEPQCTLPEGTLVNQCMVHLSIVHFAVL